MGKPLQAHLPGNNSLRRPVVDMRLDITSAHVRFKCTYLRWRLTRAVFASTALRCLVPCGRLRRLSSGSDGRSPQVREPRDGRAGWS